MSEIDMHFFIALAKIMLGAATLFAILHGAVDVWSRIKLLLGSPPPAIKSANGIGDILGPLKDLIEALTKAPAWFAMYIAGLGLIWVTRLPVS